MKKPLFILVSFLICSFAFAQTSSESERREYARNPSPGELYFLETTEEFNSTRTRTNNLDYMWYPARLETWFSSDVDSTNSLIHIYKHTEEQYLDYEVVTNEFGNTVTNYLHALTNTVTTYTTNTVCYWTNSSSSRAVADDDCLKDYFFQRSDHYKFSIGNTNNVRVRIIGRR